MKRHSQRGVALIITVILLAVLTLTTLAFLSMSRRERGAVTTATDTTSARLAADAALANAEGQILANALSTTNPYNFGLLVSTNYINPAGFIPAAVPNPMNVNYYYAANGQPVSGNDFLQLLANLYYSPRPPVFIPTNTLGSNDFRFYLDLNRNGVDDPNGWVTNVDNFGNVILDASGNPTTNFMVGDPEWIGVLQRPDQPCGPNNPFVARFAFIALPIGNALDLNAIHNQVLDEHNADPTVNSPLASDVFMRNQGVGSWEINLAAFLADLNTNEWGQIVGSGPSAPVGSVTWYQYNEYNLGNVNRGRAFDDARALLAWRYANEYTTLLPANLLFASGAVFQSDNIDGYSDGPLQTTLANIDEGILANQDNPLLPWAGADNTNHFFTHQELFNTGKTASGVALVQIAAGNDFSDRLLNAGTNTFGGSTVPTYDRYTFYRLLSQLGTDSAPERNKINVNYSNAAVYFNANGIVTNIAFIPGAETNFTAWTPVQFFTIAADKMLRDYSQEWLASNPSNFVATFNITNSFGITNIPVLIGIPGLRTNFVYTPAIQRVLQLAANIYDAMATNNRTISGNNFYDFPSVFRPIFEHDNLGNVFITGYTNISSASGFNTVTGPGDPQLALPHDVMELISLSLNFTPITDASGLVNVYGVPWIIGAKKGFPNFNEFSMLTLVGIERKLEITRPTLSANLSQYQTNQMYILSISNSLGVECWNSYASNYFPSLPNGLTIVARDNLSMALSNMDNGSAPPFLPNLTPNTSTFPFGNAAFINGATTPPYWPGTVPWTMTSTKPSPNSGSFDLPLTPQLASVTFLTNSIYVYQGGGFYPANSFVPAEINTISNYVDSYTPPLPQFDLVITNRLQVLMLDGNHVLDYVQFAGPDSSVNLNSLIADVPGPPISSDVGLWNTNLDSGVPYGVINQILYSTDPRTYGSSSSQPRIMAQDNGTWRKPPSGTVADAIAALNAFLNDVDHTGSGTDLNNNTSSTTNTGPSVQVPFTPVRYVYGYTSWQANDPLVHYLASDLNFTGSESGGLQTGWHLWDNTWGTNAPPTNLGRLNDRYAPWGLSYPVSAGVSVDTNVCNVAYKDPLVRSSDNWDFPTNKFPTVGWLGRVHRGTPWQTVYLKATNILALLQLNPSPRPPTSGPLTWEYWSGNVNPFDAANAAPIQDWLLFDLFTTTFNDNATRGQLPVNVGANDPNNPQAGLAAWSALLSGVEVLSNNLPDSVAGSPRHIQYQNPLIGYTPPSFANLVINPAGPAGAGSALGQIVNGINQTRQSFTNVYGIPAFEHVGDVLAVPQLTTHSQFLNWNSAAQQANGISDEMYEWLPQQVMSLLRVSDSPRYVIYSYGQTLKPAPNSIYTGSGQFFGMVMNYQIVSETATRAVVRFDSVLTNVVGTNTLGAFTVTNQVINNNAVIESFNVMPPD